MRFECVPHAVLDEEFFAVVAEHEIQTATRLRYPVSLLALLPETGEENDPGAYELVDRLAATLGPILRSTDRICHRSEWTALSLLLVDAALEALPGIIQRIAAETDALRFLVGGDYTTVTLSVGGACFPTTARTTEELVNRADTLAAQARRDHVVGSRYRLH